MENFINRIVEGNYEIETKQSSNKPGEWSSLKCKVRKIGEDKVIFEYTRPYPAFFHTFFPFVGFADGKQYALYSENYTCTSLLDLEQGKSLGSEEPNSCGFCPVDFFVPLLYKVTEESEGKLHKHVYVSLEDFEYKSKENNWENMIVEHVNAPYGFVAGCIWGDDSSWKIQLLDLKNVDKGEIKRLDDFLPYIEMPQNVKRLSECISLPGNPSWFGITSTTHNELPEDITRAIQKFWK